MRPTKMVDVYTIKFVCPHCNHAVEVNQAEVGYIDGNEGWSTEAWASVQCPDCGKESEI